MLDEIKTVIHNDMEEVIQSLRKLNIELEKVKPCDLDHPVWKTFYDTWEKTLKLECTFKAKFEEEIKKFRRM
jgi:hypothetical protein